MRRRIMWKLINGVDIYGSSCIYGEYWISLPNYYCILCFGAVTGVVLLQRDCCWLTWLLVVFFIG